MNREMDKEDFKQALPADCVRDCSARGDVTGIVRDWAEDSEIARLFPSAESIRADLAEHGAWDDAELQDESANRERYLWTAACDRAEEEK